MVPPPGDDPQVPPPPPPGDEGAAPEAPAASGAALPRARLALWERIGGRGLTISVALHGFLLILFAVWVVTTITDTASSEPDTFATGSGGGSKGEKAVIRDHKVVPRHAQNVAKNTSRITSKSSTASVALPDLPALSPSSMMSGMTAGGASKGFGGGSGGGIGSGKGVGVGNGRNFVGKPVMGAQIVAQKIAVYMDASGSMVPYLPAVIEEIQRQFPDADFYNHNGGFIFVHEGKVVAGRKSNKLDEPVGLYGGIAAEHETKVAGLSSQGKAVFRRFDTHFRKGGLGAWIDVMLGEKYDAIIVFSDFQDGVTQTTGQDGRDIIYSDGRIRTKVENRKPNDKRWERQWIEAFSKSRNGESPRLYLFSTDETPQPLLQQCVEASSGETKMVTWLRIMPEALSVLRANPAFSRGEFSASDFAAQVEASRPGFRRSANGNPIGVGPGDLLQVLIDGGRIKQLPNGNYSLANAPVVPASGSSSRNRAGAPPR